MSISRADFLRTLPAALGHCRYQINQHTITIDAVDIHLTLRLSEEGERRIAALTLPVMTVEFEFEDGTPEQMQQFMERFQRCFQRGGG